MKKFLISIICATCVGAAFAAGENVATSKAFVDTAVALKQDKIPANDGTAQVLTNTGELGNVGTKNIYDSSATYVGQSNALIDAGTMNAAVQNAIEAEFRCIKWVDDDPTKDCLLVNIFGTTPKPSGKNLFDKNNLTRIYGWFPRTGSSWEFTVMGYSIRIPCRPNTTYTARYNGDSEQAVLNFASTQYEGVPTEERYSVSCTNSIRYEHPTKNTPVTITTGPNDKYIIVQYNVVEPQNTDMANNLQIEEGAVATAYEPYKNLYMPSGN